MEPIARIVLFCLFSDLKKTSQPRHHREVHILSARALLCNVWSKLTSRIEYNCMKVSTRHVHFQSWP